MAGTGLFNHDRVCFNVFVASYELHRYQVTNQRCVDISGRRFACTLTERDRESSKLRARASKQVSVLGLLPSRRLRASLVPRRRPAFRHSNTIKWERAWHLYHVSDIGMERMVERV